MTPTPAGPVGTVYDPTTNLLWEMKTANGTVHDVNRMYTWIRRSARIDSQRISFTLANIQCG